jgi:hypothetical protein
MLNVGGRHRLQDTPSAARERAQREFVHAGSRCAFQTFYKVLAMNDLGRFMFLGLLVSVSASGFAEPPMTTAGTKAPMAASGASGAGAMGAMGPMHSWHGSKQNTEGWAMMSAEERQQHQAAMRAVKTPEQCQAMLDKHHAEMMARAKAKGQTTQEMSPHAACAPLGNTGKP